MRRWAGRPQPTASVVANPTIHYLIVAGRDPDGHRSGQTLGALANSGVDDQMRIVGSMGKRPILRNVTREEVEAFRGQVRVADLVGCEDIEQILKTIEELATLPRSSAATVCDCGGVCSSAARPTASLREVIVAQPRARVEMDRAGYFAILPDPNRQFVVVEHYAYDNQLQQSSKELKPAVCTRRSSTPAGCRN